MLRSHSLSSHQKILQHIFDNYLDKDLPEDGYDVDWIKNILVNHVEQLMLEGNDNDDVLTDMLLEGVVVESDVKGKSNLKDIIISNRSMLLIPINRFHLPCPVIYLDTEF